MRKLLDSNFYSILYYSAVIWLTPAILAVMKQSLLSISANALRTCVMFKYTDISFDNIHKMCKKCTPAQIMHCQISLNLHKQLNAIEQACTFEHVTILNSIICPRRQTVFEILRTNNLKIGWNTTAGKLFHINKQIILSALALPFIQYKKFMKIQFLKFGMCVKI